jgi:hypothetical protein
MTQAELEAQISAIVDEYNQAEAQQMLRLNAMLVAQRQLDDRSLQIWIGSIPHREPGGHTDGGAIWLGRVLSALSRQVEFRR